MSKLLFLEGDSGIGKSTMILEAAAPFQKWGNGFFSQRLVNKGGQTKAFALVPYKNVIKSIACYEDSYAPNEFIRRGKGNEGIRLDVFDAVDESMKGYEGAAFLVLDEIGGVELSSQVFREKLYSFLRSGIPCVGVVKSRKNWERMRIGIECLEETKEEYERLREEIISLGGEIVELNNGNRNSIKVRLELFFKEIQDGQET